MGFSRCYHILHCHSPGWNICFMEKPEKRRLRRGYAGWAQHRSLHRYFHNDRYMKEMIYRSGMVNSKSFVGKVLLRIKRKFELN